MKLWIDGSIAIGGGQLAIRQTFALLDAVAAERSVRGAAERLELSYRAAWGRLSALEQAFGRVLATKTKGHGTVLTPDGLALLDSFRTILERSAALLADEEDRLGDRLRALVDRPPPRYRIAVSHDPVLMEALASMTDIDVEVVGSLQAVRRLLSGQADGAGFHLDPAAGRAAEFTTVLDDGDFDVAPLFPRQQGLMLAAGNPLRIDALADLARPRVRFVNRQRGSGTRTLTDRLLAKAGLPSAAIRGYETEEFTHQAVAALIAAGMADAGMGVRAAAERFGLGFLPMGEETYFFAARRTSPHPATAAIVAAIRSASKTPG